MLRKRIFWMWSGFAILGLLGVTLAITMWVIPDSAQAQGDKKAQTRNNANPPGGLMQQRLDQIIRVLQQKDPDPEAVGAAIDNGMGILYGGLRPLPSLGLREETHAAHMRIGQAELQLAKALEAFVQNGKPNEQKGRALDLKLLIEEMHEVAQALAQVTAECGLIPDPDDTNTNPRLVEVGPCDELAPLLDEEFGEEGAVDASIQARPRIGPSYQVKLRSPFVPRWFGRWDEEVLISEPIATGECVVVFKESRGLMLRLHFDRIIKVNDPWVATFGLPRGTLVPIWTLEWVPSEYVKEWNLCNVDGTINKTVTKRVVQDIALKYFWRFY